MCEIVDRLDQIAPYFVLDRPYVLRDIKFGEDIRSSISAQFREHISPTINAQYIQAYVSAELHTAQRESYIDSSSELEAIFLGLEGRKYVTFRFLIVQVKRKNGLQGIEYVGGRIGTFYMHNFTREDEAILYNRVNALLVRRAYTLRVE